MEASSPTIIPWSMFHPSLFSCCLSSDDIFYSPSAHDVVHQAIDSRSCDARRSTRPRLPRGGRVGAHAYLATFYDLPG